MAELLSAALNPTFVVSLALTAGVALLWTRWHRLGRALATATVVLVVAADAFSVDSLLVSTLENRFAVPDPMPAQVDGIIVLGGSVQVSISQARGMSVLNHNGDRLVQFAALARQYPTAQLVFTGGGANADNLDEWLWSQRALADLGVDSSRLTIEGRSTSTYENAVFGYEVAAPQPGQAWLLVTSAWHMPRAIGSFRVAGWEVIPYPVAYLSGGGVAHVQFPWRPFAVLTSLTIIGREWLALAAYRYLGRTDAFLPGP